MTSPRSSSRTRAAVATRFAKFIGRIQPTPSAVTSAARRVSAIERRLATTFDVRRFVRVGSYWKGTAIRACSDLDLFLVVSRDEARWGGGYVASTTLLGRVRDQLRGRFPATPGIRRDGQAVVVAFSSGGPGIDVTPAFFDAALETGQPLYVIPDGDGGWLATSPDAQKRYLSDEDARSGGKLRRVVQIMKWWAQARANPLPLRSIHLEMLVASEGIARVVDGYSSILAAGFARLAERNGSAINDPLGVSGRIPAAGTAAQKAELMRSANHAAYHSAVALAAEADGDLSTAIHQWRIILPSFPS